MIVFYNHKNSCKILTPIKKRIRYPLSSAFNFKVKKIWPNYWTEHNCELFSNSLEHLLNDSWVSDEGQTHLDSLSEISQTDYLMLLGIHSKRKDEIAIKSNFNSWNKHIFYFFIFFMEFSSVYSFYYLLKFQTKDNQDHAGFLQQQLQVWP